MYWLRQNMENKPMLAGKVVLGLMIILAFPVVICAAQIMAAGAPGDTISGSSDLVVPDPTIDSILLIGPIPWNLALKGNEQIGTGTLQISSNWPWMVTVSAVPIPGHDNGRMVKYVDGGYVTGADSELHNPLRVKARKVGDADYNPEVDLSNLQGTTPLGKLISGGEQRTDIQIEYFQLAFLQQVSWQDKPTTNNQEYRIDINFEITPQEL